MEGAQITGVIERILIIDEEESSRLQTTRSVTDQLPSAIIEGASSLSQVRRSLQEAQFDVVVLDHKLSGANPIELLHEIRLGDSEPAVLVVSPSSDPSFVADMYNHGCQRFVAKEGTWRPQLGATIRHALRYRKLRERNLELQSRLVQANLLLAEKNHRLDEFSATVAHDIRGPLAALSMKLDFILSESQVELDARARTLLTTSLESVDRLTRIVQSMYEYAKLGAGVAQMNIIELGPLVQEVLTDMLLPETTQVQVGLGELPAVWGNRELLRRLFMNLISNAVKYNDSELVHLNIGIANPAQQSLSEAADIYIEDNGRGIPEREQRAIFGMFQRGSSAKSDSEGLGIGLAAVERIAELHRGRVWVDSEVGKGSRFTVSLHRQAPPAPQA